MIADEHYIRDCILYPNGTGLRELSAGDAVVRRPDHEEDLIKIVAYIKSLGREGTTP